MYGIAKCTSAGVEVPILISSLLCEILIIEFNMIEILLLCFIVQLRKFLGVLLLLSLEISVGWDGGFIGFFVFDFGRAKFEGSRNRDVVKIVEIGCEHVRLHSD